MHASHKKLGRLCASIYVNFVFLNMLAIDDKNASMFNIFWLHTALNRFGEIITQSNNFTRFAKATKKISIFGVEVLRVKSSPICNRAKICGENRWCLLSNCWVAKNSNHISPF